MDFALDEEQSLLVATFRRWSERALRGWAADADRQGAAPEALWGAAAELGLLLDAVPAAAGGLADDGAGGYSHLARALRGIELGRGCAALAALCETNVEPALAAARWGSHAAREALFAALVAGSAPGVEVTAQVSASSTVGVTAQAGAALAGEVRTQASVRPAAVTPQASAPPAVVVPARPALAVTAHDFYERLAIETRGGSLSLTGRLGPLPGLARATHVLVAGGGAEPVLLLLPTSAGRLVPSEPAPSGWRAAAWAVLALDRAIVPAELVLARGPGARAAVGEVLSWYRVGLAARAVGVATAAIEHAAAYGEDRIQFGRPIGRFESLARMRDENQTAIAAARLLVLQAAWEIDRGLPGAADSASRARDYAALVVTRATIDAVQIFGGYGFVNDYPVEKLMRDARAFEVLGGNEAFARVLAAAGES